MNYDPMSQELIDSLKHLPFARLTTDGREMRIRCPFCGDSIKHANSTHLYIKVVREDPRIDPFPYYCQRCQTRGLVNSEFLKKVQVTDTSLGLKLVKINHHASKVNKKYKVVSKTNLKLPTNYDAEDRINDMKLRYLNSRLGLDLKYTDLHKLKIVLNLYDLLDLNNVKQLTCPANKGDTYDQYFLGFVSYDNNFLIQRNTSSQVMKDVRYNNYNIFNNHNNAKKFYVIPGAVDIMADRIKIVLAEGSFDILGIYHHLYGGKPDSKTIFSSINGVGYLQVINQILKVTSILDYDLEIYSDNDQPLTMFKVLKRDLGDLTPTTFKVHYNTKSKDYGVHAEDIQIVTHII